MRSTASKQLDPRHTNWRLSVVLPSTMIYFILVSHVSLKKMELIFFKQNVIDCLAATGSEVCELMVVFVWWSLRTRLRGPSIQMCSGGTNCELAQPHHKGLRPDAPWWEFLYKLFFDFFWWCAFLQTTVARSIYTQGMQPVLWALPTPATNVGCWIGLGTVSNCDQSRSWVPSPSSEMEVRC